MLTAGTFWVIPEDHDRDDIHLAMLMQVLLFCDGGESAWRDATETYTCSLGIVTLTVN